MKLRPSHLFQTRHQGFFSHLGFTLIEVLIAVAILASLSILISSSWSGNVRRHQKSKIKLEAAELLQRKMTEIEARYRNDVPSIPIEQVLNGNFEEERYENYTWEWEAKQIELPDMTSLISTDGQDQMLVALMSQFRDYLVAAVREVKVTVSYQKGSSGQPLNFTVATYFVDFNQNLSMGLGETQGLPAGLNPNNSQPQTGQ